ncbi:roadblock/LC7 domain-containing protein [Candidatus Uabimicrobium amorphum]|uniref:Roadblock/LAMTOR2 domain-containing protein n=1 Tax=Uabimicrobium amorphum TaxID=2596890 RepID=A0A5S9F2C2_UABAM|nr:roadblock/LC7 domain-containing protein [Candidatus Uabimicrobium amorphum]BBM83312.1 hypothetical protein UABAM_01663 [Candidatus Uabimicrobium amorphum]
MNDYQKFIQKNLRLPYIHHMLVADLQGNILASSSENNEDEAVMCSFLHQSALQMGTEFGLSSFRHIAFEHGSYKCVVTEQKGFLLLAMLDKNVSDSKYLSYLEQMLQ